MEKKSFAAEGESEPVKLLRAAGVLGTATLLSRVLGYLRDALAAMLFGLGGGMDAFIVAFRIPSMFRSMVAEGSLTVSFLPIYAETREKRGEEAAGALSGTIFSALICFFLLSVMAAFFAAPLIVSLFAPGFKADPEKFSTTVELTRMLFPYVGLATLTAFLGGLLNAWGVFLVPALGPVVLNISIIAAAWFFAGSFQPPVAALAAGVLIGGGAQLLMQLYPLVKKGIPLKPALNFKDPALARVLLLLGPSVFGIAVYQVNIAVSTFLASLLPDGSVSYLYYAERLFQLPLGLFSISLGVASLPSLSRLASKEDWAGFRTTLDSALGALWFLMVPAAAGLYLLSEPIILALFKRGSFTGEMAASTGKALALYTLALVPVATARVLAQSFYARKDTKTPVKAAAWSLAVNLSASLLLMGPLGYAGLALSTGVSSLFNLGYLWLAQHREHGCGKSGGFRGKAGRILLASLAMALVVWAAGRALNGLFSPAAFVALSVAVGLAAYSFAAWLLKIEEMEKLVHRIKAQWRAF